MSVASQKSARVLIEARLKINGAENHESCLLIIFVLWQTNRFSALFSGNMV